MSLIAQHLCVQVSDFDLLRGINLEVTPGKITVIVGPNGAGKSSLLKAMTAELKTASGQVLLNDQTIENWQLQDKAQVLAVLSQHTRLNFPFSAQEVVALGRIPHQTGAARDKEIVAEALHRVDADYLVNRSFVYLSGGEKQRVQLARILAQIWEPSPLGERYLLLDEPTAAFDLSHQQVTLDIVREFASQGVGVLMVLHDLNLAAKCADNLVVLNCGVIAAQGSPGDILTKSLVDDVFGVESIIQRHPILDAPMVII